MTFQPFRLFGDATPRRPVGLNPTQHGTGPWADVLRVELPEGATGHLAGPPMGHPADVSVFPPLQAGCALL